MDLFTRGIWVKSHLRYSGVSNFRVRYFMGRGRERERGGGKVAMGNNKFDRIMKRGGKKKIKRGTWSTLVINSGHMWTGGRHIKWRRRRGKGM